MTTIRVNLDPGGYDVLVGPVEASLERIQDLSRGAVPILVSEPRVFGLYGQEIAGRLGADPILVPEGEVAKDWQVLHRLLSDLADKQVTRSTPIIALGGGSVGDVAGLAASLFKRGCPVVHIPTTLLAQADSAVGGKTAIDAFGEKNLIGTFHQPALVAVDPAFLDSLEQRQLRSGYAEVVKYGLVDDPSLFAWCETNGTGVLAGHRDLRQQAVVAAVGAKARIVAGDIEDRSGRRALLNLGHSFGHAIEAEAGLGTILHGEAVALGTALAFRFSSDLNLCPAADTERVAAHLHSSGLPTRLADVGLTKHGARLAGWMSRDKKNSHGQIALVLVRGIGRAYVDRTVDARRLTAFLDESA
jgi:3-dehydroquinate synthase